MAKARRKKMRGEYHEKLHETIKEYTEREYITQNRARTDQEKLLNKAYTRLVLATGLGELTPWDKEAHTYNLRLLAVKRKRELEEEYNKKTLKCITGRNLKKEMKNIEHIINDCKKIEEKALKGMNQ